MKRICGTKQVIKAMQNGTAVKVFLASDADLFVLDKVKKAASEYGYEIVFAQSMAQLGRESGITVGAATAAEIRH